MAHACACLLTNQTGTMWAATCQGLLDKMDWD
jgi:hypothetical protein